MDILHTETYFVKVKTNPEGFPTILHCYYIKKNRETETNYFKTRLGGEMQENMNE